MVEQAAEAAEAAQDVAVAVATGRGYFSSARRIRSKTSLVASARRNTELYVKYGTRCAPVFLIRWYFALDGCAIAAKLIISCTARSARII